MCDQKIQHSYKDTVAVSCYTLKIIHILNKFLFLEEATAIGDHAGADLSGLSIEDQIKQQNVWSEELAQIEDEICTLRTVLASKMRRSAELKRNLGITVWKEVSDDINQGIKNVKESNV